MARKINLVKINQRGNGWQAVANFRGTRLRPQFATEEEAIIWAKAQEARMAQGFDIEPPASAKSRPAGRATTLGQLLQHTITHRWNSNGPNGGPITSAKSRIIEAEKAIEALGGEKVRAASLDYLTIETKLTEFQLQRGNSVGTTNRRKSALTVMLKEAVKLGAIDQVPSITRKAETYRRHFRLTPDLETAILRWAWADCIEFYDYLVLSLYLGARMNQILRIRLQETTAAPLDPFVEDDVVVFPPGLAANKHTQITVVPMRPIVQEVIARRRKTADDPAARVLQDFTKRKVAYRFEKMKATLMEHPEVLRQKREGLPVGTDFSPHICRHEFCSRLGDVGYDLHEIQRFSGHATAQMCARYVKPTKVAARLKALRTPGVQINEGLPGGAPSVMAPFQTAEIIPMPRSTPSIDLTNADAVADFLKAVQAAGLSHLLEAAIAAGNSTRV